ncbi:MAG: hypothetical protein ACRYFS_21935 [Janthinobacterium lividum]
MEDQQAVNNRLLAKLKQIRGLLLSSSASWNASGLAEEISHKVAQRLEESLRRNASMTLLAEARILRWAEENPGA